VDDVGHLGRQHAAVGVAQRHDLRPGLDGGAHHLDRVGGVEPVPVEEVLGVQEHPPALVAEERHGVPDHREVLRRGGAQGQLHVAGVALGHQRHDLGE
jgi:hypothetical protein